MGWEEGKWGEVGRVGIISFLLKQDQHFEIKAEKKRKKCEPEFWQPDSIYNLLQQISAKNICPKLAFD